MDRAIKKYNFDKIINFTLILGLSLLPFIFIYVTKFFMSFDNEYMQKMRFYDIFMLFSALLLLICRKNFNSINNDILYGGKSISKSSVLSGLYGTIILAIGFVIVKDEVIYLTNFFPYLENFKFFENINYFDFYDKIFWGNVSFVNNLTFLSSFLKVWLVGFMLIFNPFSMNGQVFEINTKVINIAILFGIVILLSMYDSLNVQSIDLIKANYYFFKQSLILLIMFIVLCNINDIQKEKKYRKVIFSSEVMLFYVIIISIQTIFYHYIYKVYFLEVVLIILVVALRDKFNIKTNKYFFGLLSFLLCYELGFLIIHSDLIDKDILEKIIAMSIFIVFYFYKNNITNIYRKKYPKKSEEDFKLENLKNEFVSHFGEIFNASKIEKIISDGVRYKINDEILFEVEYSKYFNNYFYFKFNITYIKDEKYEDWFLGVLKERFRFGKNMNPDGSKLKINGKKINNKIKIDSTINLGLLEAYENIIEKKM